MYRAPHGQWLSCWIGPVQGASLGCLTSALCGSSPFRDYTGIRHPLLEWKLQGPSRPGLSELSWSVGPSKSQGQFGFRWGLRKIPALTGRSGQATRQRSVHPRKEGTWPFLAIRHSRVQIPAPALTSCVALARGCASPRQSSPLSIGLMPMTEKYNFRDLQLRKHCCC